MKRTIKIAVLVLTLFVLIGFEVSFFIVQGQAARKETPARDVRPLSISYRPDFRSAPVQDIVVRGKNARLVAIRLGERDFFVEAADTDELRERGLSGRPSLAKNKGMLFVSDKDVVQRMWMKGMRFDLDIIWLDRDGAVIKIVKRVRPDSYPRLFSPEKKSRYVLEVPAGTADTVGLAEGGRVPLPSL